MLQNHDWLPILQARHIAVLSERQAALCACLVRGWSDEEIALELCLAESSVRREIAALAQAIVEWTEVPPRRGVIRRWTPLHFECCTRRVRELLDAGQFGS